MKNSCIVGLLLATLGVVSCLDNRMTKIKDKYIVNLKDGVNMDAVINRVGLDAHSSSEKFSVFRKYHSALNGFAAEMTQATADKISKIPEVKSVEEDTIGIVDVASTSWGLDRVDQRDLPLDDNFDIQGDGAGVTVYVLDTGVRETHQEFGGRARREGDYVGDDWNGIDCHGHGTHCAGTAAGGVHGIARAANIVSVRIFNCQGSGALSGTLAGIDNVTLNAQHPAVMSMSFRYLASQSLDDAIARAVDSGIVAVAAAGNENFDACFFSPSREPKAITVGATDINDDRAYFSNYGPCVDIYAPGVSITSSSPATDTAIAIWSGTSMATPHVAGVAAIHLGNGVPADEVVDRILEDSSRNKIYDNKLSTPNKLLYL